MEIRTTPRKSGSGRTVRYLVNFLSIATTLLAVAFIVPTAMGLQRYVITGGSMSGSIELGSVVFSEVVPVSDLQVGDVITYMPPAESGLRTLVTHRIVSIDDGVLVTQGDANADVDPWTFSLAQPTQARVSYSVPYVGHVFMALADRETRMRVIGIPAGVIALVSLVQLMGALRRRPHDAPSSAPTHTPVSHPRVPVRG